MTATSTAAVDLPPAFQSLISVSARYKGRYSGRGCAKTHSFAQAAIILAGQRGWRFLCCREHQKSIRDSVKRVLDDKIEQSGLSRFFHSTQNEIGAKSGGGFVFEGLHANVQGIRSKEGCRAAWVEEAATVRRNSLETLIPTMRLPRSELWFSWNPRYDDDPVDSMLRGKAGELTDFDKELALKSGYDTWADVRRVSIEDNPFFPEVLRAEMERDKRRDPARYEHIWMGGYAHDSDQQVFRNWKIGTMEVPKGHRPYYGADWGFSVDPTVLIRCFLFEDIRVLYVDAEVGSVGIEIDRTPAFFDSISETPHSPSSDELHPQNWPIMADSSRPETISYMQGHGYPRIERARKGPGSVIEGVEFLKSFDILVHPRCKRVANELTHYSYERDKHTDEVLPVLADENNHTIDALRYSIEAVRRNPTATAFPEVIRAPLVHVGDPAASSMRDPTLSPGSPRTPVRGVMW
jgi:phage terminase large subunit